MPSGANVTVARFEVVVPMVSRNVTDPSAPWSPVVAVNVTSVSPDTAAERLAAREIDGAR